MNKTKLTLGEGNLCVHAIGIHDLRTRRKSMVRFFIPDPEVATIKSVRDALALRELLDDFISYRRKQFRSDEECK